MIEIPALVTTAWNVLYPYLPIIATKAAEEAGKTAVVEVWTAIKKKFDMKAAAKEALEDLLKNPEDGDAQGAFRNQLKKLLEEDNTFASDLASLLEKAGSDYKAQVIGGGAIAQGDGATAVGQGGVHIGGNASGNTIVTGTSHTINSDEKKKK
jgi:hypothetical protein